jgi:hypothetical protein
MSRVWLGAAWRQGSEHGLEAEFEIAHGHDAVDGPLAELGDQSEDFGGGLAQAAVLLVQAVEFSPLCGGRSLVLPAPDRSSRARLSRNNAIQAGSLAGDGGADVACIARNVIPRVNPPVYCVQDSRYDSIIPANLLARTDCTQQTTSWRPPRIHRTGRTMQFNARAKPQTVEALYAIAD